MESRTSTPCYGCQDRAVGCHSKCDRYISWSKEHNEKRMAAYKAKEHRRIMQEYLADTIAKYRRKKRK